jgi:hypothetical protein
MTITNKNVISFRCHRFMVSWVDTVAPLFIGGRSGFLRLLLVRMALEQDSPANGIGRLFNKHANLELPVGGSYTFHIRINDCVLQLIKDVATEHGQTIGEWWAIATYQWHNRFKSYQDIKELKEGIARKDWLPGYVQLFIENCSKAPTVYAQKRGHPPVLTVSDTSMLHGTEKSVVISVTSNIK